jgi:hypothetical protein
MDKAEDPIEAAFHAGFQLYPRSLEALGASLVDRPDDLELRARYCGGLSRAVQVSAQWRTKFLAQALWWLEHHPDSFATSQATRFWASRQSDPDAARIRAAWLAAERRHSKDASVVAGAGEFLAPSDPVFASELLRRAVQLDLSATVHPLRLSLMIFRHFRALRSKGDPDEGLCFALDGFPRALLGAPGWDERAVALEPACRAALECGEHQVARRHATELLAIADPARLGCGVGSAIHHAHLVLGGVALFEGDVTSAKHHLLEAGRTPGGPKLDSFGPNMQLAKDLIQHGERSAVVEYLDLCARFWESGRDKLVEWKTAIAADQMPKFGANLYY